MLFIWKRGVLKEPPHWSHRHTHAVKVLCQMDSTRTDTIVPGTTRMLTYRHALEWSKVKIEIWQIGFQGYLRWLSKQVERMKQGLGKIQAHRIEWNLECCRDKGRMKIYKNEDFPGESQGRGECFCNYLSFLHVLSLGNSRFSDLQQSPLFGDLFMQGSFTEQVWKKKEIISWFRRW